MTLPQALDEPDTLKTGHKALEIDDPHGYIHAFLISAPAAWSTPIVDRKNPLRPERLAVVITDSNGQFPDGARVMEIAQTSNDNGEAIRRLRLAFDTAVDLETAPTTLWRDNAALRETETAQRDYVCVKNGIDAEVQALTISLITSSLSSDQLWEQHKQVSATAHEVNAKIRLLQEEQRKLECYWELKA